MVLSLGNWANQRGRCRPNHRCCKPGEDLEDAVLAVDGLFGYRCSPCWQFLIRVFGQDACFGEAVGLVIGDDDMIQDRDVHAAK